MDIPLKSFSMVGNLHVCSNLLLAHFLSCSHDHDHVLVLGKGCNTSIMSAKSSKTRFATIHASSSVLLSIWPCLYMHLACAMLTLSRCTPSNIIRGIYTHFPNKFLVEETWNGTSLDCYDKSDCMKTNHRPRVWVSSILRILIQCLAGLTRNRVSSVGFT